MNDRQLQPNGNQYSLFLNLWQRCQVLVPSMWTSRRRFTSMPGVTTSHCPAALYPNPSLSSLWSHGLLRLNKLTLKRSGYYNVFIYCMCMCPLLLTVYNQHNSNSLVLYKNIKKTREFSSSFNVPLMLSLSNRTWSSLIILLVQLLTSHHCMKVGWPWT